jgi:hypothetical protein
MIITATAEEQKKRRFGMTDIQFKAMVKMCLTMAETTRDVKDFKKKLRFTDNGFGAAFVMMLGQMADSVGDMVKVKQTLLDIMMMDEGGN